MKIIAGAALLTLVALPAQADEKNVTYEFRLLSESQRSPQGVVTIIPITPHNEIIATLVLTHKAFKEGKASVSDTVQAFTPPVVTDDGVVSFAFDQSSPQFPAGLLDFPINAQEKSFDNVFLGPSLDLNFDIVDGELSGDIAINSSAQQGPFCDLQMHGTDGNWSGVWGCGVFGPFFTNSFTAIPFHVEPGHEHDHDKNKVADRR